MSAVLSATVGESRIVENRLALLAEEFLQDAVATTSFLQPAATVAAVKVTGIAVVTLFAGYLDSVAAPIADLRFQTAVYGTSVPVSHVSVFALLGRFEDFVAAGVALAEHAFSVSADIAIALDIGCTERAASIDTLRAGTAFLRRSATRTGAIHTESAHTLQVRGAGSAVASNTLCYLRTTVPVPAAAADSVETPSGSALIVHHASSTGAVDARLTGRTLTRIPAAVFPFAAHGTTVTTEEVSIVTLFPPHHDAVATANRNIVFNETAVGAAVPRARVAVVAFLTGFQASVAAGGTVRAGTGRRIAHGVARTDDTDVACFTGILPSISADACDTIQTGPAEISPGSWDRNALRPLTDGVTHGAAVATEATLRFASTRHNRASQSAAFEVRLSRASRRCRTRTGRWGQARTL